MTRKQQLLDAVKRFRAEHQRFIDGGHGSVNEAPGAAFWDALKQGDDEGEPGLLDVFEGSIPKSCRELAARVQVLSDRFFAFDIGDEVQPIKMPNGNAYSVPREEFWRACENVYSECDRLTADPDSFRKQQETLEELLHQNVPFELIARMRGLKTDDGRGKHWVIAFEVQRRKKLERLYEKDASSPGVKEQIEKLERQAIPELQDDWEPPVDDLCDDEDEEMEAETTSDGQSASCPESAYELWQQGVQAAQAARMLGWPEKEVRDAFAKYNAGEVPGDESQSGDVDESSDDIDQQIILLHEAGDDNKTIASTLGIDGRKVAGVLRKLQREGVAA